MIVLPRNADPPANVKWPVGTIITHKDGCTIIRDEGTKLSTAPEGRPAGRSGRGSGRGSRGSGRTGQSTSQRARLAEDTQAAAGPTTRSRNQRKAAHRESSSKEPLRSPVEDPATQQSSPKLEEDAPMSNQPNMTTDELDLDNADDGPRVTVLNRQTVLKGLRMLRVAQRADPVYAHLFSTPIKWLEEAEMDVWYA